MSRAGFEGYDLCAAGGAVVDPVGETAHLWVATLASVLAQSVGEGDYLLEGPQEGIPNDAGARVAASRAILVETQLALFAEGADHKVGFGN